MLDKLLEEALVLRRMLLAVSFTLALAVAPVAGCASDPEEGRGPAIGSEAPGFTLEALDGREVSLAALTDDGPVVLVFFRGVW